MKNNNLYKTIMFISSYFPLYIFILILWNKQIINIFYTTNKKTFYLGLFWIILLIFLIIISILSIILLKKGSGNREIKIKNISTDDSILSYIMTYIIPLLTGTDTKIENLIINILLFILNWIYLYKVKFNLFESFLVVIRL